MLFQWDAGNIRHIVNDHPERDNTITEVESLFEDPYFRPLPDRVDRYNGEQQFSGVAIGNEGIEKHVVYVIRNGQIRPITCRRATRKQREQYHVILNKIKQQNEKDGQSH
ncbi:BrnT family toxin [Spirosoma montaniterrae]|uniref:BrnT family toxin n=1 Tax=Spirosoma montaniterrae TaxID=1178516 RepID=A0A1P9WZ88_9BACT|nr:BrnT family toxin [Spirosoma montaniterrae]AQG80638.1 hypothetical protein AWR27_15680 [Spirosoma montaniterrae]